MGIFFTKNGKGQRRYYARKQVNGTVYTWPSADEKDRPWRHRWQAQERMAEVERAIADGEFERRFGEHRVLTVAAAGEKWFATGGEPKRWKEKTREGYRWVLNRVIASTLADMPLDKVTRFTVTKFKRDRESQVSTATVNRELAALSGIFEWAIAGGMVRENPVRQVRRGKESRNRWTYPDPAAIETKFLPECRRSRNKHLYGLVLCWWDAGLRVTEALTLRIHNVRLDLFPREGAQPRGAIVALETKNDTPRAVPLTDRLRAELIAKIGEAKAADRELLFPAPSGAPYVNVRKAFERVRTSKKVAMPPFRIYDLRHGFASRLSEQGIPDQWISALLGHTDTQMVNRYSHMRPELLGKAADALTEQAVDAQKGQLIDLSDDELQWILQRRRAEGGGDAS